MGKRSRKRPAPDRPTSTRAERDARRQAAAVAPRRATKEAPPAPWGSFPLTELVVFLALVFGVVGFIRFDTRSGKVMVVAAMVLGSLGGLEVSIREHFSGFRSHTTLLAGAAGVAAAMVSFFTFGKHMGRIVFLPIGLVVFAAAFWPLRQAFKRRSGGLGFRA
jgi:hypothetical protein